MAEYKYDSFELLTVTSSLPKRPSASHKYDNTSIGAISSLSGVHWIKGVKEIVPKYAIKGGLSEG